MRVRYEILRRLKLLRDYEIIDFLEDADSGDVVIVYADRAVRDGSVEVCAVLFDIELEDREFDPRNYRRLPPEREREAVQKALARRERELLMPETGEEDGEEIPF